MKILLLTICENTEYIDEELGLSCIAAVLRERGHQVDLKIYSMDNIDYPSILEFNPRLIGMSVYNQFFSQARQVSLHLKEMLPDTYICWGGYLVSNYGDDVMRENEFIDFAISGEGETIFPDLAQRIENSGDRGKIPRLIYGNCNNQPLANPGLEAHESLDSMPFAGRDVLLQYNLKVAKIFFTRGCNAGCTNCTNNKVFRIRSEKNIVDEIEHIVKVYNVNRFDILDHGLENRNYSKRLINIAQEVKKRNLSIYYYLYINDNFSDDLGSSIDYLIDSGLCGVHMNLLSGNEFDRKLYGRTDSLENCKKTLKCLDNLNIHTSLEFINFNPYSTFERLRENVCFLSEAGKANPLYLTSSLVPEKGSSLFDRLAAEGLLMQSERVYVYECKYVDHRVGQLVSYIDEYFHKLNSKFYFVSKLSYYSIDYLNLLYYLKKRTEKELKARNILMINETEVVKILQELADSSLLWFEKLLNLAESGWNEYKADSITDNILGMDFLYQTIKQLDIQKNKLCISLVRLDSKYLDLL